MTSDSAHTDPGDLQDDLTPLLRRFDSDPDSVMRQLWEQYYDDLVRIANAKLGEFPRRELDEEDVALSAMHSFYRGFVDGRFAELRSHDELWRLLLTITKRKAGKKLRRHRAERRGGGRVRGESVFSAAQISDPRGESGAPNDRTDDGADIAATLLQQCSELLAQLDDPTLQTIAILRLEGHSNKEIARKLDCVERTIERKLMRIRSKWQSHVG